MTPSRIKTSIPAIDEPLGGLLPGEVYVIAGRPKARSISDYARDLIARVDSARELSGELPATWEEELDDAAAKGLRVMVWVAHLCSHADISAMVGAVKRRQIALVVLTYTQRSPRVDPTVHDLPHRGALGQMANAVALISTDGDSLRWVKNRGGPLPESPISWGANHG